MKINKKETWLPYRLFKGKIIKNTILGMSFHLVLVDENGKEEKHLIYETKSSKITQQSMVALRKDKADKYKHQLEPTIFRYPIEDAVAHSLIPRKGLLLRDYNDYMNLKQAEQIRAGEILTAYEEWHKNYFIEG